MKKNELALVSLLIGISCFVQLMGIERVILAVVLGVTALNRIQKDPELGGKTQAQIGIALAITYLIILVIGLIVLGPQFFKALMMQAATK